MSTNITYNREKLEITRLEVGKLPQKPNVKTQAATFSTHNSLSYIFDSHISIRFSDYHPNIYWLSVTSAQHWEKCIWEIYFKNYRERNFAEHSQIKKCYTSAL